MGDAVDGATADYVELTASARVASIPLGHLSIELGHLYADDFAAGPDRLKDQFQQVVPWVATARDRCAQAVRPRTPRISTCFLVDDYFGQVGSPRLLVPQIVAAAAAAGLEIDYLVRESGCAVARDADVARLVEGRLVADPPPGTTGRRPAVTISGWLCNGERTPAQIREAMREPGAWRPPSENGANRHSIFVDVQLWDEYAGRRRWSCAYLAAVWQLLRLGLLRYDGNPVAQPEPAAGQHPDTWPDLPVVTQLSPRAAPFSAYRTFSVLAGRFLPVELAVQTVLSQYAVEPAVAEQIHHRAQGEGLTVPSSIIERIEYALVGSD